MRRAAFRFVLALACAACGKRADPAPAPASSASATRDDARAPHEALRIDPSLVREGRIQVAPVERRALRGELLLAGEVVPSESGEADVTTLAAGRVASLDVTEGARVKKGQLLARIDAPEVGRATADLLRARSRAATASRLLARQLDLEAQQATSKNAVDEARAEQAAADADLLAARTLLANLGGEEPPEGPSARAFAKVSVAVRAPIDGVVVKRMASIGSPVTPDKPLFHIVAPEQAWILARLPETSRLTLTEGTAAKVRARDASPDPSSTCAAHVVSNFRVVDDARNVPVRLALDGACPGLTVGRYVDVLVPSGAAGGAASLVVPKEATIEVRGGPLVFVQLGEGAFAPRAVRLGPATASDVVVDQGLDEGERVVVKGAVLLKGEMLRSEIEGAQ